MSNTFSCAQCDTLNQLTSFSLRERKVKNTSQKCVRCGATHCVSKDSVDIISPTMFPLGVSGKPSPWVPPDYRPVIDGEYECVFTDVEPVLILQWDGRNFTYDSRAVQCRTLLKWRGVWA